MSYMFRDCSNLTTIPLIDTSSVTNMSYMFYYCSSLQSIPALDTSKVTSMSSMFRGCSNLKTIPQLDTSSVTNMWNMFYYCSNLTEINMTNINCDLDISSCTKMEKPALVKLMNNLVAQDGRTRTLTMGSTLLNKLSDEDKQIATNKGWTLE